jgi:Lrp/AsnC family transcriptional regulator for asnA, asnC and gidA
LIIAGVENIIYKIGSSMLDSLDQKLINLLMSDSTQKTNVLAEKLGVNQSTVRRRINKLFNDESLFFSVLPNPDILGFSVRAILSLNVIPGKVNEVAKVLSSREEVKWIYPTSGRYDILLIVWFTSNESIFDFVENVIGKLDGVTECETSVCLRKVDDVSGIVKGII